MYHVCMYVAQRNMSAQLIAEGRIFSDDDGDLSPHQKWIRVHTNIHAARVNKMLELQSYIQLACMNYIVSVCILCY